MKPVQSISSDNMQSIKSTSENDLKYHENNDKYYNEDNHYTNRSESISQDFQNLDYIGSDHNTFKNKSINQINNKKKEIKKLLQDVEKANDYVHSISRDVQSKYSEIEAISRLL